MLPQAGNAETIAPGGAGGYRFRDIERRSRGDQDSRNRLSERDALDLDEHVSG